MLLLENMANNEDSETKRIDELLAQAIEEEKKLKTNLSKVRKRIKSLAETRAILTGQDTDLSMKSIPDLLEKILRGSEKPMHIKELTWWLKLNYQMPTVTTQTVSGALTRYANKGKRFERVDKNTFTLLGKKQENNL